MELRDRDDSGHQEDGGCHRGVTAHLKTELYPDGQMLDASPMKDALCHLSAGTGIIKQDGCNIADAR